MELEPLGSCLLSKKLKGWLLPYLTGQDRPFRPVKPDKPDKPDKPVSTQKPTSVCTTLQILLNIKGKEATFIFQLVMQMMM